jgi:drug/metabolite transporter (DMT)-like permease
MERSTIGVLLGLGAGLLWGTVFVAPQLLPSFGPVEVALGRYFLYGVFSTGLLVAWGLQRSGRKSLLATGKKAWPVALAFAFSGNVGMYLLLVLGIRLAGAPVATALIGTVPVTVAVAGNLLEREFPWRRLALPLALILPGLLAINLAGAEPGAPAGGGRLLGLLCVLGTVGLWTFYGVANARFLRANPSVSGLAWSTMVGVATLALVVLAVPLVALLDPGAVGFRQLVHPGARLAWFVAVSAFLGVVVSWGGLSFGTGHRRASRRPWQASSSARRSWRASSTFSSRMAGFPPSSSSAASSRWCRGWRSVSVVRAPPPREPKLGRTPSGLLGTQ